MNTDTYKNDPRRYALELIEEGAVSSETLIQACLGYMSHDDVRAMLDANMLSPRFDEDED